MQQGLEYADTLDIPFESIAAVTASGGPPWASAVLVRYPPRAAGLAAGAAVGLLCAPAGGHGELVFLQ